MWCNKVFIFRCSYTFLALVVAHVCLCLTDNSKHKFAQCLFNISAYPSVTAVLIQTLPTFQLSLVEKYIVKLMSK